MFLVQHCVAKVSQKSCLHDSKLVCQNNSKNRSKAAWFSVRLTPPPDPPAVFSFTSLDHPLFAGFSVQAEKPAPAGSKKLCRPLVTGMRTNIGRMRKLFPKVPRLKYLSSQN